MRLGRHQYGCLHSAGPAALEELHLPAKTDREYNRRPSSPRGRRWGRETHTLHVIKGNDVIFRKGESLAVGRRCVDVTFLPAVAQSASCSDSRPLSMMQISFDSRVIAQCRLCAPGVCFPRTIWPFGHQAGAAAQSGSQGCSTIRPIIDNNRVEFGYSDSDFGLYPLSACLPRGLRPRHRRFKRRGAVCSRWANSSKPPQKHSFCLDLSAVINPHHSPRRTAGLLLTPSSCRHTRPTPEMSARFPSLDLKNAEKFVLCRVRCPTFAFSFGFLSVQNPVLLTVMFFLSPISVDPAAHWNHLAPFHLLHPDLSPNLLPTLRAAWM